MHPLRPPGAGFLRGMDLTAATTTRLDRIRQVLHERVRRDIDASPPLLRAGVLIPLVWRGHGLEMLLTPRTDTVLTHKGQIPFPVREREDAVSETLQIDTRERYAVVA